MEFKTFESETHELIVVGSDESFNACIAVHSTKLGPALGGIRLQYYETNSDMVGDALRLSESMSYKNAAAGLPYGGGKSTINAAMWTKEIAAKYAELINYVNQEIGVAYIGAPDMNTDNDCMKEILDAGGTNVFYEPNGGDCSLSTAYGVFQSLEAISTFVGVHGKDFTVNIEGLGKVGKEVLRLCSEKGWDVCVSDIDKDYAMGLAGYYGAAYAPPEDIQFLDGVYCPCSIGGTVDKAFVEESKARAVCGSANNQLTNVDVGMLLASRNKLYIPDFIANAGGVIAVGVGVSEDGGEGFGLDNEETLQRVEFIRKQASALLLAQTTQVESRNAQLIAINVAREIIYG